jgi:adenosine deaminase
MMAAGLEVTLNTDDPSICGIRLSDEYRLACEQFDFSLPELCERVIGAARVAFLNGNEKQALIQRLRAELQPYLG